MSTVLYIRVHATEPILGSCSQIRSWLQVDDALSHAEAVDLAMQMCEVDNLVVIHGHMTDTKVLHTASSWLHPQNCWIIKVHALNSLVNG